MPLLALWLLLLVQVAFLARDRIDLHERSVQFALFFFGDTHTGYWQNVISNAVSAVLLVVPIVIYWLFVRKNEPGCFGILRAIPEWKPYLLILLIMIPVTLIMSTQDAFLSQYPKAYLALIEEIKKFHNI